MEWTIVTAVNNDEVLRQSLLSSPEIGLASAVIQKRGFSSAASAYNAGIREATTDCVVLVHQDVFLPAGWLKQLEKTIEILSHTDPGWGVLGIWGLISPDFRAGHLYDTSLQRILGRPFDAPVPVTSLDELLLVVRRSSGLRFDEGLDGFHLYGTDICLAAAKRGMNSYAISAFCIHNTNRYRLMPLAFWKAYLFIRRKWINQLPIATPCALVTYSCWPIISWNFIRMVNIARRRDLGGRRVAEPAKLYKEIDFANAYQYVSP